MSMRALQCPSLVTKEWKNANERLHGWKLAGSFSSSLNYETSISPWNWTRIVACDRLLLNLLRNRVEDYSCLISSQGSLTLHRSSLACLSATALIRQAAPLGERVPWICSFSFLTPFHGHGFPGQPLREGSCVQSVMSECNWLVYILVISSSSSASASAANSSGVFFLRIKGFGSSWVISCTSSRFFMLYWNGKTRSEWTKGGLPVTKERVCTWRKNSRHT